MKKILIIEDEIKIREELKIFLENNGYLVEIISDFSDVINYINKIKIDLILLDINLPNINGQFICKELRKDNNTPIIMITSKNTELDELISLNYGADDYITKPFNLQILLARIERTLNRNRENSSIIEYKDFVLDISKSAIVKNNNIVDLSKNEFKILHYLLTNKGKIVSRDNLIDYLWDNNEFIDDNTLTVNISRIKNKLSIIGYEDVIVTKRGQGYIVI